MFAISKRILLILLLLVPVEAWAQTLSECVSATRVSATSIAATITVASGTLLVAHASIFNGGGNGEPTISDTVNGSWTSSATTGYSSVGDADSELWLWSFPNSGAGTLTVTVDPPGAGSDNDLTVCEIAGAATSTPRDISVADDGTFTYASALQQNPFTATVASGTLAQANEILFCSFSQTANSTALTEDTGDTFTLIDEDESNATGQTFNLAYKIVTATTSITCDGTGAQIGAGGMGNTGTWFVGMAGFKASGAPPAANPSGMLLRGVQ